MRQKTRIKRIVILVVAIVIIAAMVVGIVITALGSESVSDNKSFAKTGTRLSDGQPSDIPAGLKEVAVSKSAEPMPGFESPQEGSTEVLAENTQYQPLFDENLSELDLGYWYRGADESVYSERIAAAAKTIPTTGVGYCASWISYVYQDAGLGFLELNANDMCYRYGKSTDISDIKEGMVIAVPRSPSSELGMQYGHAGIIIRNPYYQDTDVEERLYELEIKKAELADKQQQLKLESEDNNSFLELLREVNVLMQEVNELQVLIERRCAYTEVKYGFVFEYDTDGNEKWMVLDSTSAVNSTPLSEWIGYYNITGEVAWGWGHVDPYSPVEFKEDIPKTVAFVYHESKPEGLKEIYGIDFDVLPDGDAYYAIWACCASSEGAGGAITLDGGAVVDSGRYYTLLGYMTESQFMRWASILSVLRAQQEYQAQLELQAQLEQEQLASENPEELAAKDGTGQIGEEPSSLFYDWGTEDGTDPAAYSEPETMSEVQNDYTDPSADSDSADYTVPVEYPDTETSYDLGEYTEPGVYDDPQQYVGPEVYDDPSQYIESDVYDDPQQYTEPEAYYDPSQYIEPDVYDDPQQYAEPEAYYNPSQYVEPDAFYGPVIYTETEMYYDPVEYVEPEVYYNPVIYAEPDYYNETQEIYAYQTGYE